MGEQERYINPYTDFGFKKLFGTELNKELLISFLNALLAGEREIADISFLNNEHQGARAESRRAIFDVYCTSITGEQFVVEMQNVSQQFYKDRSYYYSTFPVREQGRTRDWNYELDDIYVVGVLNCMFPEGEYDAHSFRHEMKLMDMADKHVFLDKLTFIYLEMPKFNKSEGELETLFDKWMYALKHLSQFTQRPVALHEPVFTRLFEQAEVARFSEEEVRDYELSLMSYRDIITVNDSAERKGVEKGLVKGRAEGLAEGLAKGRAEGRAEGEAQARRAAARRMKARGFDLAMIADVTGLSIGDIVKL